MKVQGFDIRHFGGLSDVRQQGIDPRLVVMVGANESGKSTFFHFFITMLYGILPVKDHPYAPWTGERLEGRLDLELADKSRLTVRRRLLSTPRGEILGEPPTDIRNLELPCVSHVPRDVFTSVYALTLGQLQYLEGKAWDEVQDRLLGSLRAEFLRPAREVLKELESEANSLWRPDRRGTPKVRSLEQEMRRLREEARMAGERNRQVRELDDERIAVEEKLNDTQVELVRIRDEEYRLERLIPLSKLLLQRQDLTLALCDPAELEGFPAAPEERLQGLREERLQLAQEIEEVQRQKAELAAGCPEITSMDLKVLSHSHSIRTWSRQVAALIDRQERLRDLEEARKRAQERFVQHSDQVFTSVPNSAETIQLQRLPEAELRQAFRRLEDTQAQLRTTEAERRILILEREKPELFWIGVFAMVLGVGLITGGLIADTPALMIGGLVTALAAVVPFLAHRLRRKRSQHAERALGLPQLRLQMEAELGAVKAILNGLPLPVNRLESPDGDLVRELLEVRKALSLLRECEKEISQVRNGIDAQLTDLQRLSAACDVGPDLPIAEVMTVLESHLQEAEERSRLSAQIKKAKEELARRQEESQSKLNRTVSELDALIERLRPLGAGDEKSGLETLRQRRRARQRLEELEETLAQEYPNWPKLEAEIREMEKQARDWESDDLSVARLRYRHEELQTQDKRLANRRTELIKELEFLLKQPTRDSIESEIESLQAEIHEFQMQRDRRQFLANIIGYADQRFRESHQPDVIQRASRFLSQITEGRYSHLRFDDDSQNLLIVRARDHYTIKVDDSLSQGIRDQIHWSIRLALVGHLDAGREPLPIFLDETLVNWDGERRRNAVAVLQQLMDERQVFVMTCHDWLAEELVRHLGGSRIELGRPA